MAGAARPVPARRRVGRCPFGQHHPLDASAAVADVARRGADARPGGGSGVSPRRRPSEDQGLRRIRLDMPGAGGWSRVAARVLVSVHRRPRLREPHRPDGNRSRQRRRQAGAFRVRELSERDAGRVERIPANDLGGRAEERRGAIGFRAPSRGLRLRGCLVSRGACDDVRGADPRRRPVPPRRQGCGLPHSGDGGRLSRALSRLSARPRSPGRACTLAIRLHVGQPRVLVERLAESAELRECASRADAQGGRESGVVRVSAGTREEARQREPRALRRADRRRCTDSRFRRAGPWRGARQSRRHQQSHDLSCAALGPQRRPHPHRQPQLSGAAAH